MQKRVVDELESLDAAPGQVGQHRFVKMQCGGGGSHGAGCAGKNSLVTLAVLGRVGVGGRDRFVTIDDP